MGSTIVKNSQPIPVHDQEYSFWNSAHYFTLENQKYL